MTTVEDRVQELAANQPMILYRLDQADEHRDRIDGKQDVLPVLSAAQLDQHERIVALEKTVAKQARHQQGSKRRQDGALAGAGGLGIGASKLEEIMELLGKMFGG